MFNLPLLRPALITVPTVSGGGFTPITSGLVNWFKLADGSGTSAIDSINGDTGTLSTTGTQLPIWSSGVPSSPVSPYSLLFDGSTNQVGFTTTFAGALPLSIACWIYPLTPTGTLRYFWFIQSLETGYLWTSDGSNSSLEFDNDINGINTGNIINLNQWQHVVLTYDASNNAVCYVNGVNQSSGNVGGGLTIFGRFSFGCNQFNGNVADFRLYNRILSSTEVSEIYNLTG